MWPWPWSIAWFAPSCFTPPPVPPEAVPAASAAADARYERFIKNVVKSVQGHSGVFDQLLGTDPLDVDQENEPL